MYHNGKAAFLHWRIADRPCIESRRALHIRIDKRLRFTVLDRLVVTCLGLNQGTVVSKGHDAAARSLSGIPHQCLQWPRSFSDRRPTQQITFRLKASGAIILFNDFEPNSIRTGVFSEVEMKCRVGLRSCDVDRKSTRLNSSHL